MGTQRAADDLATVDLETLDFCSVNEVADLGHVNHFTVRRAIDRGDLQAFRVGGSIRIRRADVAQWLLGSPVVPAARRAS